MTYLPDVNVWIALAAERHTHHWVARRWFRNLQDEDSRSAALPSWAFCGHWRTSTSCKRRSWFQMRRGRLIASCDRITESATWRSRPNFPKRGGVHWRSAEFTEPVDGRLPL